MEDAAPPRQPCAGYSFEISAEQALELDRLTPRPPRGTEVAVISRPHDSAASILACARHIHDLGLVPVPHLAARRFADAAFLRRLLGRLRDCAGVDRVFVIAGDEPSAAGPFRDSSSLIESGLLEACGIRHVGIAGYPDGHPHIDAAALQAALLRKRSSLAQRGIGCSITTQFSFEPEAISRWLERLRASGFDGLVRLGIAGPAETETLRRFAVRFGVPMPEPESESTGCGVAPAAQAFASDQLLARLQRCLSPHCRDNLRLHFLTFGGVAATVHWVERQLAGQAQASSLPRACAA